MLDWSEYGKFLVALWALIHPIGAVPVFLSLTEQRPAERKQIGLVASAAAGVILIVCVCGPDRATSVRYRHPIFPHCWRPADPVGGLRDAPHARAGAPGDAGRPVRRHNKRLRSGEYRKIKRPFPPPAARPHRRTQAGRVGGRAPAPGGGLMHTQGGEGDKRETRDAVRNATGGRGVLHPRAATEREQPFTITTSTMSDNSAHAQRGKLWWRYRQSWYPDSHRQRGQQQPGK